MTDAAPRRGRAKRGEGDRTRALILDTTRRLLLRTGDAAEVSIRAIAAEADLTAPTIYRYFETKDDLLFATCEESFAELDRLSNEAAETAVDPIDRLRARGRAYVDFGLEHPEQYRLLFMTRAGFDAIDAPERLARTAAFHNLVDDVAAAIASGHLRRDLEPFAVAVSLWAGLHGITSLRIAKPDFPWPPLDDMVRVASDAMLAGFTA